jgi:hypothetical protein
MNVMIRRNVGGLTGGEEGVTLEVDVVPDFLVGVVNTRNLYWMALAILVLVYLACVWVERSRLGHVVAAARENELRVTVLGLRPYLVRLFVFAAAAVLAAVAGMGFMMLQSSATPRISTSDFTLTLLVIVVLGGVGYRWGAIVGGIIYTLLDQRLAALASAEWIQGLPDVLRIPLSEPLFILGMLFVLVVMFAPGGFAGMIERGRFKLLYNPRDWILPRFARGAAAVVALSAGAILLIEIVVRWRFNGKPLNLLGMTFTHSSVVAWVVALGLLALGLWLVHMIRRVAGEGMKGSAAR